MSEIMVTGINGFVGKHLVRELQSQGHNVVGAGREPEPHPEVAGLLSRYHVCELTDEQAVHALPLESVDAIISLAGLANVGASFDQPDLYNQVNVAVLSVLGEMIVAKKLPVRVIAISTGAVYDIDQPMPLHEDSRLIKNGSPYALSKIAMEQAALDLRQRGLACVVVRPFNHIGPGQEGGFLVPDLYAKIQAASQSDGKVMVGDLTTRRDYTDVRDVVKAYVSLATASELADPVYNVCSGRSVSGETILDILLDAAEAKGQVSVEIDSSLIRPNDPKDLFGSNQRLQTATGWLPTILLEQTLTDFVNWKHSA